MASRRSAGKARQKAKGTSRASKPRRSATKSKSPQKAGAKALMLLSGGNPQVAKADGDMPVQAYIAALPGWVP